MIPALPQSALVTRASAILATAAAPPVTVATTYEYGADGAYLFFIGTNLTVPHGVTIQGTPLSGSSPEALVLPAGAQPVLRSAQPWQTVTGVTVDTSDSGTVEIRARRPDGAPATASTTVYSTLPCRAWLGRRASLLNDDEGPDVQNHLEFVANSAVEVGDELVLDAIRYAVITILPVYGRRVIHHYRGVIRRIAPV